MANHNYAWRDAVLSSTLDTVKTQIVAAGGPSVPHQYMVANLMNRALQRLHLRSAIRLFESTGQVHKVPPDVIRQSSYAAGTLRKYITTRWPNRSGWSYSRTIKVFGWSVEDLQHLFRPTRTMMFYIKVLFQSARTNLNESGQYIDTDYNIIGYFGLGHLITLDTLDTEYHTYETWALDAEIEVYKVAPTSITFEVARTTRNITAAAGFDQVYFDHLMITLASVGLMVYVPPSNGTNCLKSCVERGLEEMWSQLKLEQDPYYEEFRHKAEMFLEWFDDKLKEGEKSLKRKRKTGLCGYSSMFLRGVMDDASSPLKIFLRVLRYNNGAWNSYLSFDKEQAYRNGADIIFNLGMVNLNGEFARYRADNKTEPPKLKGYHYVLLNYKYPELQGTILSQVENEIGGHIHKSQSLKNLYYANRELMAEASKQTEKTRKRKERQYKYGKNKQKIPPVHVLVYDLESFTDKKWNQHVDIIPAEFLALMELGVISQEEHCVLNIPYCAQFAYLDMGPEMLKQAVLPFPFGEKTTTKEDYQRLTRVVMKGPFVTPFYYPFQNGQTRFENCIDTMMRQAFAFMTEEGMTEMWAYGHGACKYDAHLLSACSTYPIRNICPTSRGILRLTFGDKESDKLIHFQCTYVHMNYSLDTICKTMNIPAEFAKLKFDFKKRPISLYTLNSKAYQDLLMLYAKNDIVSLALIVLFLERGYQQLWGNMSKHAWKLFLYHLTHQSFLRKYTHARFVTHDTTPNQLIAYDEMLLKALRGGLTQTSTRVFESRYYKVIVKAVLTNNQELLDKLFYTMKQTKVGYLDDIDMNSLYPTTAKENFTPCGPGTYVAAGDELYFKVLEWLQNDAVSTDWFGIFHVTLHGDMRQDTNKPNYPKYFSPVSFRREDKLLYATTQSDTSMYQLYRLGVFDDNRYRTAMVTSDDLYIWNMAGAGSTYTIKEGIVWSTAQELTKDYAAFATEFYQRRKITTNAIDNRRVKDTLNGTLGSEAIRRITEQKEVLRADDNDVVRLHESDHHHVAVSACPVQLGLLFEEAQEKKEFLVSWKAHENHSFARLSRKSTFYSRILSASRLRMFKSLRNAYRNMTRTEVCEAFPNRTQEHFMDGINYMDTDSFFPIGALGAHFDFGEELGQFKNELGDTALIVRMFAPAAKMRCMEILRLKQVEWEEKGQKYKQWKWVLEIEHKMKGMPFSADNFKTYASKKLFWDKLEKDWEVEEDKVVWRRSPSAGVSIHSTKHKVQFQSLVEKKGLVWGTNDGGDLFQRFVPMGSGIEPDVSFQRDWKKPGTKEAFLEEMQQTQDVWEEREKTLSYIDQHSTFYSKILQEPELVTPEPEETESELLKQAKKLREECEVYFQEVNEQDFYNHLNQLRESEVTISPMESSTGDEQPDDAELAEWLASLMEEEVC